MYDDPRYSRNWESSRLPDSLAFSTSAVLQFRLLPCSALSATFVTAEGSVLLSACTPAGDFETTSAVPLGTSCDDWLRGGTTLGFGLNPTAAFVNVTSAPPVPPFFSFFEGPPTAWVPRNSIALRAAAAIAVADAGAMTCLEPLLVPATTWL